MKTIDNSKNAIRAVPLSVSKGLSFIQISSRRNTADWIVQVGDDRPGAEIILVEVMDREVGA
jgi:hypothetical protein